MKLSELFFICDDAYGYQEVGHSVNYKFYEEDSNLIIFFQGSNSVFDWIRNFLFGKRPYKDMAIPYRVHRGFLAAWKEVEDIIIEKISDPRWKDITVVGYSHGGSLCAFCTECIWFYRPDLRENHMRGIAFESPRILAQWALPEELRVRWKNFTVVRVGNDLVTHCPPIIFGYRHLGSMLKIKANTSSVSSWYIPHCIKCHYPQVVYQSLLDWESKE